MSRKKLFVSYSRQDSGWLARLWTHLATLERRGLIHVWWDDRISAGAKWEQEIQNALSESQVAVLLVSPAFLASSYIWEKEMPHIVAHKEQGMTVLPLLIKPCAWRLENDLSSLQARPSDGRAMSTKSDAQADLDLSDFAYELATIIGQVPQEIALKERQLTEQHRALQQLDATPMSSQVTAKNQMPQSWIGFYNGSLQIQLKILEQKDSHFHGSIQYLNQGTKTVVKGHIVENKKEIANDSLWRMIEIPDTVNDQIALVFKEICYLDEGEKRVDFNGEYRAFVSSKLMTGAWFSGQRLVGHFKFELDDG